MLPLSSRVPLAQRHLQARIVSSASGVSLFMAQLLGWCFQWNSNKDSLRGTRLNSEPQSAVPGTGRQACYLYCSKGFPLSFPHARIHFCERRSCCLREYLTFLPQATLARAIISGAILRNSRPTADDLRNLVSVFTECGTEICLVTICFCFESRAIYSVWKRRRKIVIGASRSSDGHEKTVFNDPI